MDQKDGLEEEIGYRGAPHLKVKDGARCEWSKRKQKKMEQRQEVGMNLTFLFGRKRVFFLFFLYLTFFLVESTFFLSKSFFYKFPSQAIFTQSLDKTC